jgi:hypothetical protein
MDFKVPLGGFRGKKSTGEKVVKQERMQLFFTYPAGQIGNQRVHRPYYKQHKYEIHESVAHRMRPAIYIKETIYSENNSENEYYPTYKVGRDKKYADSFKPWKVHFCKF